MDEYILFADETNKTPNNPYFCFAGFIISRTEYERNVIPTINALKEKYFGSTKIIFHNNEMNGNKGAFSKFSDPNFRNKFYMEFVKAISNFNISIIGVYYDFNLMKDSFGKGSTTNYDIAFRYLLENYMHFLREVDGVGTICIESRTLKENVFLQNNYYNYHKYGSLFFDSESTKRHLASIGFVIKGDNCVGLQIADIFPSRLMRTVNGIKDNFKLDTTIKSKIYKTGTPLENVVGLKKIL
jgi:hypothetical protein